MRGDRVLVTGGAGFVGSHLVDSLLERGHRVRILDNLDPQVHQGGQAPPWIPPDAELIQGDVRDSGAVARAASGMDVVIHLAAAVGVGQSMYRIAEYTATNSLGTANLLQALVDSRAELKRLVVASSMSIYGEGRYLRPDGDAPLAPPGRSAQQLREHRWEPVDRDGAELVPVPTDEDKPLDASSIYALTKADQERMALQIGEAFGIPTVALRFFNIYGPRQALSNPYTGVMAIFSSRLLNGKPPLIYEDGEQRRDFVSVHDIVRSLLLAMDEADAVGHALNIGSGESITVRQVADMLAHVLSTPIQPEITGRYRVGDIRHCTADIGRAERRLGYRPRVSLEEGMRELVEWLAQQERPRDGVEEHAAELSSLGLTV